MTVAQTAFTFTTPGGASYTLAPGGSTTFNLVLNTGSYSGPITFGTSTLPAGVTVTFAQVPPGTASPITVAVTISYNQTLSTAPTSSFSLRPIIPGGPGSGWAARPSWPGLILTLPLAGRGSAADGDLPHRAGPHPGGWTGELNNTGGGTGNQGQTARYHHRLHSRRQPATTTVNLTLTR